MLFRLALVAMQVVKFAFFAGLIGCTLVVVFSWVSILKDGFSSDVSEEENDGLLG